MRDLQLAKGAIESTAAAPASGGPSTTIKEMAREVLSGQPDGLNSSGILDGIRKQFGREIERTSLSPQLSRMKDDNEVVLDGDVWFTAEHYAARTKRLKTWQEAITQETRWDDGTDAPPF